MKKRKWTNQQKMQIVLEGIKEDLVWPYDWESPFLFEDALTQWVTAYNTDFPHQSLGYKTPSQFMNTYHRKEVLKSNNNSLALA